MTSGRLSSLLILLALLAGMAGAAPQPDRKTDDSERIARFLAMLAPPRQGAIPFVEQRMSELFAQPVEVRGELSIGADGTLDKHVTFPAEERVVISSGALTIEKGGTTRTIDLAGDPRWRAFHAGITGLINRDAAALVRVFAVTLAESADGWSLELRPRKTAGKHMLTMIRASGRGPEMERLRLEQGPADWQEMTFPRDGG